MDVLEYNEDAKDVRYTLASSPAGRQAVQGLSFCYVVALENHKLQSSPISYLSAAIGCN